MSRPRISPFRQLLEQLETHRCADTPLRVKKYNLARAELITYVREVERSSRFAVHMLTETSEVANSDGPESDTLERVRLMLRRALATCFVANGKQGCAAYVYTAISAAPPEEVDG